MIDWTVNELVSLNALSGPALSLWLHLKGLAWERGACDPTDEHLAELMGGVTTEMVRITRRELRGKHLLLEGQKPGAPAVRWLIPLPVLAGLRGQLPAEIGEAVASGEAQLRQMLAQFRAPQTEPHPGSNGNSPQVEFGANSICPKFAIKEEEEGEYPGEIYLPPPPERANASARGNGEGGVGGGRIYPKQDLGQIQLGANSAGGEIVAVAADPERADLTAFLVEHGIFASVAGSLVAWMLAHKTVAEAKVYALAHLRAVQEGENPRGQRLQGEQVIGRWVARLREHARAPERALTRAAQELACAADADEAALDDEDSDGEDSDGELPDAEEELVPEEAAEPAPPLPTIACWAGKDASELTVAELWQRTVDQLRYQLPRSTWETWVRDSRGVDLAGDTLVVAVSNQYAAEWLGLRLQALIGRTLQGLVGRKFEVEFRVAAGATP
jgi:hypothetical protein